MVDAYPKQSSNTIHNPLIYISLNRVQGVTESLLFWRPEETGMFNRRKLTRCWVNNYEVGRVRSPVSFPTPSPSLFQVI